MKTGKAPLTVVLQFDTGWESTELRRLMKNTNSADRDLRLQMCDYFETDTVSGTGNDVLVLFQSTHVVWSTCILLTRVVMISGYASS